MVTRLVPVGVRVGLDDQGHGPPRGEAVRGGVRREGDLNDAPVGVEDHALDAAPGAEVDCPDDAAQVELPPAFGAMVLGHEMLRVCRGEETPRRHAAGKRCGYDRTGGGGGAVAPLPRGSGATRGPAGSSHAARPRCSGTCAQASAARANSAARRYSPAS